MAILLKYTSVWTICWSCHILIMYAWLDWQVLWNERGLKKNLEQHDLFLNSYCLSHSWLKRLAYLKVYLFPFLFHLHLKFPDMPKGMRINARSGEEYYCGKFIPRHERECHNKMSAPKYFRLWERAGILISQLSSLVDSAPANWQYLLHDKCELYSITTFHLE